MRVVRERTRQSFLTRWVFKEVPVGEEGGFRNVDSCGGFSILTSTSGA